MLARFLARLALLCMSISPGFATTPIDLYAYHAAPPFLVNPDTGTGLNSELVKALQPLVGPAYQLQLKQLARPELNKRLAQGLPTIVLWTHPSWYGDEASRYLWVGPLFGDRDVLVSLTSDKRQPFPVDGYTLGAMKGYSYPGLNEKVAAGSIKRLDGASDKENLLKLVDRRVDAIVITRSSFLYFAKQPQYLGKFHVVGQPYDSYHRQVLLTKHYHDFAPVLAQALKQLETSAVWQERLELYGLKAD